MSCGDDNDALNRLAWFDRQVFAQRPAYGHPYRIRLGGAEHCLNRQEALELSRALIRALDDGYLPEAEHREAPTATHRRPSSGAMRLDLESAKTEPAPPTEAGEAFAEATRKLGG